MTFRYIGSKARLADRILERVGAPSGSRRFVDLFCGTGAVAVAAAARGWDVHLNDHLHCAVITAAGRLIAPKAITFDAIGGYEGAIAQLNAVTPLQGFIYREYSPASFDLIGMERRYFTADNAAKVDAVRLQIREWRDQGALNFTEETLLIADLISATNRVANIAGTYGCFMRKWQGKALTPLILHQRKLAEFDIDVSASVSDAGEVEVDQSDTVYLDPPYTKRQYAAYYHLLETIALGDAPAVSGVAGIRPWQRKASDFCYKTRAMRAFTSLINGLGAERVLVSYSDNAHLPIEVLSDGIASFGLVTPTLLTEIGRYRPNRTAGAGRATVKEYLIELQRTALQAAA
jgi:adenine-specific DNA-methyltransferase